MGSATLVRQLLDAGADCFQIIIMTSRRSTKLDGCIKPPSWRCSLILPRTPLLQKTQNVLNPTRQVNVKDFDAAVQLHALGIKPVTAVELNRIITVG